MGLKVEIAQALAGLSAVAHALGRADAATRLASAADAMREQIGAVLPPVERAARERDVAALREALGDAAFTAAWTAARQCAPEHAISAALGVQTRVSVGWQATGPASCR
jgi:hypothetical protein